MTVVEFATPGESSFVVPSGVTLIRVDGWGSSGFGWNDFMAVTPGETLSVRVGGRPMSGGGYNGGGDGPSIQLEGSSPPLLIESGGGGATDIRRDGERIFVAPGAGGRGYRVEATVPYGQDQGTLAVSVLPGPTNPNRATHPNDPFTPPPVDPNPGGEEAGGDAIPTYQDANPAGPYQWQPGAGGGGYGGGAGGNIIDIPGTPTGYPVQAVGGLAGAAYSASGLITFSDKVFAGTTSDNQLGAFGFLRDGYLLLEFDGPPAPTGLGWSVGRIGWGSRPAA